jgi:uncharacterized protein (DUF1697 family)
MSQVALLRGINVGGKNKLPMAGLVKLFSDEGCSNVSTFIASGNVLFDAPPKLVAQLPQKIAAGIQKRFGLQVPLVLRTGQELAAAVARNPFKNIDPDQLHIMFLRDAAKGALDANRSPPDEFVLSGRELYLRLPNGAGRTRITNLYVDKALATISTQRNWRTLLKLVALSAKDG